MGPEDVRAIRRGVLNVSQALFARLLNVAPQTVHAWEQGRRRPSGPALRLLWLARRDPSSLERLLHEQGGRSVGGRKQAEACDAEM